MSELLDAVLKAYPLQKARPTNNGVLALCPFHANTDTPAFSMNEIGLWTCFSKCGVGNLAQFIARYSDIPITKAILKAEELESSKYDKGMKPRTFSEDAEETERKKEDLAESFEVMQRFYRGYSHPYLLKRGLKQKTLDRFHIGYDPNGSRITIPLYDIKGELKGFQYRTTEYKSYTSERGFDRTDWLFGEEYIKDFDGMPMLVESMVDVMWLWQIGFTALASMGNVTTRQAERLCKFGFSKAILGFDNDDTGEMLTDRVYKHISRRIKLYDFDYSSFKRKDWFGVSRKEMFYLLTKSRPAIRVPY